MDNYMKSETLKLVLDYGTLNYKLLAQGEEPTDRQMLVGRVMTDQRGDFETFVLADGLDLDIKARIAFRQLAESMILEAQAKARSDLDALKTLNDLDATFATTHA